MKNFPEFHTTEFSTPDERLAASQLPPTVRQMMVTNLLVPYAQYARVKKFVSQFHRPVDDGTHGTGWIGGVIGESRAGKSFIMQSYAADWMPVEGPNGYDFPVAYLEARAEWDMLEFGRQIYHATGATAIPRMSTAALNTKSAHRLRQFKVQLVIIDDAHFLFAASDRKRTAFVSLIQHIADQRSCNVLLAGLPSVEVAMKGNPQLLNRGGFPHHSVLEFDSRTPDEREKFRIFLHGVDQRLPFSKPSDLAQKSYIADFLAVSGGSIGKVMNIIVSAGHMAINEGQSCILPKHLRKATEVRLLEGTAHVPFADMEVANG